MERVNQTRQQPAFRLVRPNIVESPLPIKDTENLLCWENLEHSLLKLDEEHFNILLEDRRRQQKSLELKKLKNAKMNKVKNHIEVSKPKYDDNLIEDDFVREMERLMSQGNISDVKEVLKTFKT